MIVWHPACRPRGFGRNSRAPCVVVDLSGHGGVLHEEVTDVPGIEQKLPAACEDGPGPGWLLAQQPRCYRGSARAGAGIPGS